MFCPFFCELLVKPYFPVPWWVHWIDLFVFSHSDFETFFLCLLFRGNSPFWRQLCYILNSQNTNFIPHSLAHTKKTDEIWKRNCVSLRVCFNPPPMPYLGMLCNHPRLERKWERDILSETTYELSSVEVVLTLRLEGFACLLSPAYHRFLENKPSEPF